MGSDSRVQKYLVTTITEKSMANKSVCRGIGSEDTTISAQTRCLGSKSLV